MQLKLAKHFTEKYAFIVVNIHTNTIYCIYTRKEKLIVLIYEMTKILQTVCMFYRFYKTNKNTIF